MTDAIRDTVLTIYDTVADPARWSEVLDQVAYQINAHGCIVFEWEKGSFPRRLNAPFFSNFYSAEALEQYLVKCFEHEAEDQDIFEAHSLSSDGIDLIDDTVLTPDVTTLKRRRNVEILQKFGILHRAAGLLNKDNLACSRFAVQFGSHRGRMTPEEHAHLCELLPHIAKALDLGRPVQQLARAHRDLLAAMDQLNIGLCLLDRRGCVIQSNEEFNRQRDRYGVFRTIPSGALRLLRDDDQARFETLKADALNHGKFGARPRKEAIMLSSDSFLCLEVTPLKSSHEIGSARLDGYIVYSTDTSRPVACNPLPIKQAFKLTDAEFSLVEAIGQGLTNTQIAENRGRAVSTINAQVKSILSKTHCATRTQFVRLMMGFGVDFLAQPNEKPTV